MTNRTVAAAPLAATLNDINLYGRQSVPEMTKQVTARRAREAASLHAGLYHLSKNGVYDPITYYHVMDVICRIDSGIEFRSGELVALLHQAKPDIWWDTTTVGRVVTDIAEVLNEAYGWTPIGYVRRWNGMTYDIIADPKARVALYRLLEDLKVLAREVLAEERKGIFTPRLNSPLNKCPSVS